MEKEREKFLVMNKHQAKSIGFTDEDIDRAENSKDGLIGRTGVAWVNDGTVPVYLEKTLPTKSV